MSGLLRVLVLLGVVVSPSLIVAATPTKHGAPHSAGSSGMASGDVDYFGRYRIKNPIQLLSLTGSKQSVKSGAIMDVLKDTSSCSNENDPEQGENGRTEKEACPWGDLIRVSTETDPAVDGHCFCTSRTNILAQEKIVFQEDGVAVITIHKSSRPEASAGTSAGPSPQKPVVPYLDKLYASLKYGSCHKNEQVDDAKAKARIKHCVERGKDLCNCSILRCAQFVKKALVDAGLVASAEDLAGNANDPAIKQGLERNGFLKCSTIDDPADAPEGAVLIYHAHNARLGGDAGAPF
ncbi:MAG: hypothetical protein ABIR96_11775, partial [Bdellovibrionota bacterium]